MDSQCNLAKLAKIIAKSVKRFYEVSFTCSMTSFFEHLSFTGSQGSILSRKGSELASVSCAVRESLLAGVATRVGRQLAACAITPSVTLSILTLASLDYLDRRVRSDSSRES